MSAQPTSPRTPKTASVARHQVVPTLVNAPPVGIRTRSMTQKMDINAAAASLRAAKVPTKERTFTAASIAAAAVAVIASNSPQKKEEGSTKAKRILSYPVASPKKIDSPYSDSASVMTAGVKTLDEQMLEMRNMLEQVLKDNEVKNKKIEDLQKEVSILREKEKVEEENPTTLVEDEDTNKIVRLETVKNEGVSYDEKQLQLLIASAVKSQLIGESSSGMRYTKPYTRRIDNLRMPLGYQPPKFQQFDGKGNPKQHIAHFVETCNNAGTEGDLFVKQFVRSLKGIAFDWYTDLDAESIDSWEHMEDEFLNRFYSTRRVVSMSELTNTKQWENEPVIDYINRWRALSLECKDRISEMSAVEMCIDGMSWDLLYILKGIKPRSFQELATRAHDMEITVKGHGKTHIHPSKATIEKREFKKTDKNFKNANKEVMIIGSGGGQVKSSPVKISAKPKFEKRKDVAGKDFRREKPTLKQLQAKKYPFPDSDLSGM